MSQVNMDMVIMISVFFLVNMSLEACTDAIKSRRARATVTSAVRV
jgi:hypothetical protein